MKEIYEEGNPCAIGIMGDVGPDDTGFTGELVSDRMKISGPAEDQGPQGQPGIDTSMLLSMLNSMNDAILSIDGNCRYCITDFCNRVCKIFASYNLKWREVDAGSEFLDGYVDGNIEFYVENKQNP